MRKLLTSFALAATAVTALVAATPGAAQAATGDKTCRELHGSTACFYSYGDVMKLWDTADGWRPTVEWETSYGRTGQCSWSGTSSVTTCNYDMREDEIISFRLVLRGGNNQYMSGGWVATTI